MQLNIYIPKEKSGILTALDRVAETTKRPKNEIVLEALERYLPAVAPVTLGEFGLGKMNKVSRADLYEGRLKP
ncbi:MAG: hypothetical protein HPY71_05605 [Firmicutes bacterium]|nr:hypothetical protein [Bacillota bacterium]